MATPVVRTRYCSESLLPSSIPDLKLDIFAVDLNGFEPEINANGGEIVLGELILNEANEDRRLAHSRITNDDCLVEMIELFYHLFRINEII